MSESHLTSLYKVRREIVVVYESLKWAESVDGQDVERDVDDFIAKRNGAFPSKPQEPRGTDYTCGYDADGDGMDDPFQLTEDIANSRPGEVWEYTWRNRAGSTTGLRDGELVVVAYGRDKSRYDRYGEDVSNWAVATGGFGLDTDFDFENELEYVVTIPGSGEVIADRRPFVLIEFPNAESVRLVSVLFDGIEVATELESLTDNEFVYWPAPLDVGTHTVSVRASDAAGNSVEFQFDFEVVRQHPFVLKLQPGWNAISFPAEPVDRSIDAMFTDLSIEAIVGWDYGAWILTVRRNGVWEHNSQYGELREISPRHGYWIKSSSYARQPVELVYAPTAPAVFRKPDDTGMELCSGCRQSYRSDRRQFRRCFEVFRQRSTNSARLSESLQDVAYTWDPIHQRFEQLLPDDPMIIGDGVWVYYSQLVDSRSLLQRIDDG